LGDSKIDTRTSKRPRKKMGPGEHLSTFTKRKKKRTRGRQADRNQRRGNSPVSGLAEGSRAEKARGDAEPQQVKKARGERSSLVSRVNRKSGTDSKFSRKGGRESQKPGGGGGGGKQLWRE